ncbi:BrnT family toxin, partial [Candidatus Sumerlaeota bacterium]|nr:BrnT family toxin [Candidatus Sumerlaeota bacterium]
LGRSFRLRVLLVCHCFRESESVIRIISARRATRKERSVYTRSVGP